MFIYRGHLITSVAEPDLVFLGHPDPKPDPVKYRILYQQKDHCNSNFLVI